MTYRIATLVTIVCLLATSQAGAASLITDKDASTDAEQQIPHNTQRQQAHDRVFEPGDLALVRQGVQLRSSTAMRDYNIIEELGRGELVTILSKQGMWVRVRTPSDIFGWVPAAELDHTRDRAVYSDNWTEFISANIGVLRACYTRLKAERNGTGSGRIINIDPGLNNVVVTLIEETAPAYGYRCTIGAYGGEIYHFDRFHRTDVGLTGVLFTPIPGGPMISECYINELLFDDYRRSLGWLTTYICS